MSDTVYVLIDHNRGQVPTACWETLALAQKMSAETGRALKAVVLGSAEAAAKAGETRVDGVISLTHESLAEYDPDAYVAALKELLHDDRPSLLVMAHIYQNIDMAPKLAAALGAGLVTDCIGFRQEDGRLTFVRQMFRNKLNADVKIHSQPPWLVTVQAGAVSKDELISGHAEVEERAVDLGQVARRRKSLEAIAAGQGQVDLSKADVIVGVGRGIKKEENLEIVRELARVLKAEIGASRPVVDNDWMDRERQIGSSGQSVSPKLYIACGISGAIQHIVGMKSANCIVAINSDPNAPIFNIASYGIVGDLFEVVPALTKKLQEELQS